MAEIRNYDGYSSFQHTVFVGRRAVENQQYSDEFKLNYRWIKHSMKGMKWLELAEEQTFIYKLYDLWDYVIRDECIGLYNTDTRILGIIGMT